MGIWNNESTLFGVKIIKLFYLVTDALWSKLEHLALVFWARSLQLELRNPVEVQEILKDLSPKTFQG
jgi:hypothetical protein